MVYIIIASLIILALASYAGYLLILLRKQKKDQQQSTPQKNGEDDVKFLGIVESLVVIAKAIRDEQCPMVEGCIRLKVLLDQLQLPEVVKDEFVVFTTVYDKTVHIPTHKAWKELKLKQRHQYTKEMMELEEEYLNVVKESAKQLLVHFDSESKATH